MINCFIIFSCLSQQNLNARKYSILYPHTAPPMGITTTESSFSFDPPPSPRSARSAEKSTTKFSFEPSAVTATASNEQSHVSHKSFKSRGAANCENKENVRTSDIGRMAKNANKAENGTSKKERRSFKCERLSSIFSTNKDSPSSANKEMPTKTSRRTSSAPVYRKNSSISQISKFDMSNDDESSSTTTGTSSDLTMFPFDREAIDYERIQRECFAVEEEYDANDDYVARRSFPYDYDTEDSPSFESLDQQVPPDGIFQQYAILSQLEKERQNKKRMISPAAEMKTLSKLEHINKKLNETSVLIHDQPSSNVTSPIPDLKIDFFSESSSVTRADGERKTENSDALDGGQKDLSTSSFGSKSNNTNSNKSTTNGSINLTSNPMSTAVVQTPRATIVVQQVCDHFSSRFLSVYLIHVFCVCRQYLLFV
jgi:hypothetical protein